MKKICVFIPCYYAESTIEKVLSRIPKDYLKKVTEILIINDGTVDKTCERAVKFREKGNFKNITIIHNHKNLGYGGNQKKAYKYCIEKGHDVVVMVHGDLQYPAELVHKLTEKLEKDEADMMMGSRMTGDPLGSGMPIWKYIANKFLTFVENTIFRIYFSEYHSGFRAFNVHALKEVDFLKNSDNYIFDQQIISQLAKKKKRFGEIPIPTYYGPGSHKISFLKSSWYGLGVLKVALLHRLKK